MIAVPIRFQAFSQGEAAWFIVTDRLARRVDPTKPPRLFRTTKELRAWFAKHGAKERELWMKYWKAHVEEECVRYQAALDEALCVGWIDGRSKSIDDESYMQRWTPRKKGSYWSAVNIAKAERLLAEGRMAPTGLAAFEARDTSAAARYSFENRPQDLPPEHLTRLKANKAAWAFWQEQPSGYRKTATWLVVSAKQEATREKRLQLLIDHAAKGERIPQLVSPAKRPRDAGADRSHRSK